MCICPADMFFHQFPHLRLIVQIRQRISLCFLLQQFLIFLLFRDVHCLTHDLVGFMILVIDRNPDITEPDKDRLITDLTDLIADMLVAPVHCGAEFIKIRPVIRMYKSPFVHLLLIIFDDHICCAPFSP